MSSPVPGSSPGLLDLLSRADLNAIGDLVADDVVFSSPVADYSGREDVVHLFGLVARVLHDPVTTGGAICEAIRLTSFTAGVDDGADVEGLLRERYDASGRLLHATLFLRPLASLQRAVRHMSRLLAESPLPSTRA